MRVNNCSITWKDISHVGEKYHLLDVEVVIYHSTHSISLRNAQTQLKGLSELRYLSLSFINLTAHGNVQDVLPYKSLPMRTLASLIIQCINLIPENPVNLKRYCTKREISQNLTILRSLYPHLQALSLSGVRITDTRTKLEFPWDNQTMILPLNLTHSKFRQRLVRDGHGLQSNKSEIVRTLMVNVTSPVAIEKVCPYDRQLNTLVLEGIKLLYVPADCFTPSTSKQSTLYFLELSQNPLSRIENGTFTGLRRLESLHIRCCELQDLQVGLFDDLTNLKLLNLDYNQLTKLQAGIFSKLISLEKLYLHYNHLLHVDHQSFPIYSHNLTFIDLKNNRLGSFPYDCLTLPNLNRCDCANNNISMNNFTKVMSYFDPIRMYFVQPLAYYGETYNPTDVAIMHEAEQAEINLRNNTVKRFLFNDSWSL